MGKDGTRITQPGDTQRIGNTSPPKEKSSRLSIDLGLDDKTKLKLRAIAKHAGALADELEAIDNGWSCTCGTSDYHDTILCDGGTDEVVLHERQCNDCHTTFSMLNEELPTRLEGSD